MHGFHKTRRRRRRQSAPTSEQCVAAVRAFSAARLVLRKQTKSVETAASCRNSNAALVQAAVALCTGDLALQARVIRGGFPLAEIPHQAQRVSATSTSMARAA
jgi:hypothetical protein